MHPNGYDPKRHAEQRAARRQLRRAQLAETRRIRQAVTDMCLLTPARWRAPCRMAALAEARQVAICLMRTRLTWPLPTRNGAFLATRIDRLLGGRDHSTVIRDVAVIAARLSSGRADDAALRHVVDALTATLDATYEAESVLDQRAA